MTNETSPTADYLKKILKDSAIPLEEVAREAGFSGPNALTMMQHGLSKVPMSRIPRICQALRIPSNTFFDTALREYYPELRDVLVEQYGMGLTLHESVLLEIYREANEVIHVDMEAGLCDLLLELFVYSGRLQAEIH